MKTYSSLISTHNIFANLDTANWVIIDCRYSLAEPDRGREAYKDGHIPGAIYAHLDHDLSDLHIPGKNGRHPLPDIEILSIRLGRWGIGRDVQVALYDDSGGAIAARLWWMLRWLGHNAVAVLDGGWSSWISGGKPTRSGQESNHPRQFTPAPRPQQVVSAQEVMQLFADSERRIFDSRSTDRYRGENETIDPVAGHIPGAISAPYLDNLEPNGLFLSKEQLRIRFNLLLDGLRPEEAVFYCGSGVTAAHNLLALFFAGLGESRLYVGSWSDWITDQNRPVAKL